MPGGWSRVGLHIKCLTLSTDATLYIHQVKCLMERNRRGFKSKEQGWLQVYDVALFLGTSFYRADAWIQFSPSVVSNSLWPHGLQHDRPPCPSPTPTACSNSCPWSRWCHPTISSSVILFSSRLQSFSASGSFPMSQFFPSGGQSTAVSASASAFPMNIQDWFPLGLTGLISLPSKRHSRIFSSTTIWRHQFFSTQPILWFNSHIGSSQTKDQTHTNCSEVQN